MRGLDGGRLAVCFLSTLLLFSSFLVTGLDLRLCNHRLVGIFGDGSFFFLCFLFLLLGTHLHQHSVGVFGPRTLRVGGGHRKLKNNPWWASELGVGIYSTYMHAYTCITGLKKVASDIYTCMFSIGKEREGLVCSV